jgi:succinate-semialdehyde dehydrogenase/glutarate-semialdehyde dehydrogenase
MSAEAAAEHSAADLQRAISEARQAQPAWARLSFRERGRVIGRLPRILTERADEVAQAIAACTGKTRVDAISAEVLPAAMAAAYYAKSAGRFLRPRRIGMGNPLLFFKRSVLLHEPWGVVGIISPWNYPFAIPFHEVVMALMAGNAVVLKVASLARAVGEHIAHLLREAGLPEGLLQLVHLRGADAAAAFVDGGVDKIFFTGSIAVGKQVMALAASKLIPVCLELGGNDAMIVCADANLDRAANGALWAGLSNCGQSCGGVERIYVHDSVVDEFTRRLAERLHRLRVGHETEFDVDIGTLTTAAQFATVKSQFDEAVQKGARIVAQTGREDAQSRIHPAVILDNVRPDMKVMSDETFGPLLAIDHFSSEDEVVAKANGTIYGLTASIWTRNQAQARRLAERLVAGAVTINDHLASHGMAETHWGGYRQSGIGRSHGQMGFEEMTQTKVVVRDSLHRLPRQMWWYPHSRATYTGLKGTMDALYGRGLSRRLSGVARLVRLFLGVLRKW